MSYVPTTQQQGQGGAQVGQAQALPQLDFKGARIAVDSMKEAKEAARLAEQKQNEAQSKLNERFGVLRAVMYPPALQGGYDNTLESTLEKIEKDPRNAAAYLSQAEEIKKIYDERSKLLSKDAVDLMQKDVHFKEQALAAFNDYNSIRDSGETDIFKILDVVYGGFNQAVDRNPNLGKDIYDFSGRLSAELLNTEGTENLFEGGVNVVREGGFVGGQSVRKLSPEGREYVIDQIYGTPEFQRQLVGEFFSSDPTETERLAKDYIRQNIGFEKVMGLSQASSGDRDRNNRDIAIDTSGEKRRVPFYVARKTGFSEIENIKLSLTPYNIGGIEVSADYKGTGELQALSGKVIDLTIDDFGNPVAVVEVKAPYDPSNPNSANERLNIEVPFSDVKEDVLQNIREQYNEGDRNKIFNAISKWEGMVSDMEKTPFPEEELENTYNQLHKIATSTKSDAVKTAEIQELLGRSDVNYVGGFSTTDLNVGGKEVKLFKFGSKAKLSGEDLDETLSTLYDADAIVRGGKQSEERILPKANSGQAPPPPPSQR